MVTSVAYVAPSMTPMPSEAPTGSRPYSTSDAVGVDYRTVIQATVAGTVARGSRIVVTGAAEVRGGSRARPRPVRLYEKVRSRWVLRVGGRTSRRGNFTLAAPAGAGIATRVFQVRAPSAPGLRPGATHLLHVRVVSTKVSPNPPPTYPIVPDPGPDGAWDPSEPIGAEPAPAGNPADWTWLMDAESRWNPCRVITWGYNPANGYAGSLDDMKRAFAKISARAGLRFHYVGTTVAVGGSDVTNPAGMDIVVAWSDAAHNPDLSGSTVGLGGGLAWGAQDGTGWVMTSGYILLDRKGSLRHGYDVTGSPTWGQIMIHEAMHAVGLSHARGREEIMYPSANSLNHRFGYGDVTGLNRAGINSGCWS